MLLVELAVSFGDVTAQDCD